MFALSGSIAGAHPDLACEDSPPGRFRAPSVSGSATLPALPRRTLHETPDSHPVRPLDPEPREHTAASKHLLAPDCPGEQKPCTAREFPRSRTRGLLGGSPHSHRPRPRSPRFALRATEVEGDGAAGSEPELRDGCLVGCGDDAPGLTRLGWSRNGGLAAGSRWLKSDWFRRMTEEFGALGNWGRRNGGAVHACGRVVHRHSGVFAVPPASARRTTAVQPPEMEAPSPSTSIARLLGLSRSWSLGLLGVLPASSRP